MQYFIREQGKGRPTRPACPDPVTIYNANTGERLDLPCKRRLCSACGPTRWRPRVLAKLHSGLQEDPERYLVVLLTAPGNANRYYFNANASHYWHRFWTSANRWWPGLAYWKVAELQQRGHVHFHVIIRGRKHIDIEKLRTLAVRSGFGAWVGIRRPIDYEARTKGAAGYLGKYLLKDYARFAGEPNLVSMSRGWPLRWREPVRMPSTERWITEFELRRLRESAITAPSARKEPAPPDGRRTRHRRQNPCARVGDAGMFPQNGSGKADPSQGGMSRGLTDPDCSLATGGGLRQAVVQRATPNARDSVGQGGVAAPNA